MGLSRKSSLRSSAAIGTVVGKGRTCARDTLKVHVLPAAGSRNLFAFAVPKYGHCIVERNRLKRRLQEIVRAVPLSSSGGRLVVVRCNPAAYEREFIELKDTYTRLVDRISA